MLLLLAGRVPHRLGIEYQLGTLPLLHRSEARGNP
jgi:hypothetical protein